MTVLKYWDTTQGAYVTFGGAPGVAYAQVAATAPATANPAIAPPMGLLWADTSTAGTVGTIAYFPLLTPPPTGFNTFTDSAGLVWISRNGSAWKQARDALKARAYRNAAWTPANLLTIVLDTISYDLFAGFNTSTGVYTCPIAGDYLVIGMLTAVSNAAGQGALARINKNGSTVMATSPGAIATAASNSIGAHVSDIVPCLANDQLTLVEWGTPAPATGYTGSDSTFMAVKYLGTG